MTARPGRTPVEIVLELYASMRDNRIDDATALTHPAVVAEPIVRPGLSVYSGHDGIARLVSDMHTAHGDYQITIETIDVQGPTVTVHALILPALPLGKPPLPVRSTYTFRDGLIATIDSQLG